MERLQERRTGCLSRRTNVLEHPAEGSRGPIAVGRWFGVLPWALALAVAGSGCDRKDTPQASEPAPQQPAASAAPSAASVPTEPSAEPEPAEEPEPEEIAAQHILIAYRGARNAPRSVVRTKAQAKKLAEEVLVEARAGKRSFAELAAEYSDDPTKHNLGNLGKFPKDRMVPEFGEPAFRLKVNEISEVVETPFGFHIIKRNQ